MTVSTSKKDLKLRLSRNQITAVLNALRHIATDENDADLMNAVFLKNAQWTDLQQHEAAATRSDDDVKLEKNRLRTALVYLIDQLSDKDFDVPESLFVEADPSVFTVKKGRNWLTIAGVLALSLLGLWLFWVKDFMAKSTFSVVVLVQNSRGENILDNQGKVIMRSRFGLDSVKISDNGEATFTKLSSQYMGEKVNLTISHPQPYQSVSPDSTYILRVNQPISLTIALKNTDKIFGEVSDFASQKLLEGVRVSVLDIETFTNVNGWFELHIPPDRQAKFQRVAFDKLGYERAVFDKIPTHTQQQMSVALTRLKK